MEELQEKSPRDFNNEIIEDLLPLQRELSDIWMPVVPNPRQFDTLLVFRFKQIREMCLAATRVNKKVAQDALFTAIDGINDYIQNYEINPVDIHITNKRNESAAKITAIKNKLFPPAPAAAAVPIDVVPPANADADADAGAAPPPPPPQPAVEVKNRAIDKMANTEVYKSIKSYVNQFNQGQPVASQAKLEDQPAIDGHDIHCKVSFPPVTNINPITFKRPTGGHLSLTTENPTAETRAQQAKILTNLPEAGPKTLKLKTDNPNDFKALWKAMREEGHHITDLSADQQAIIEADAAALAHLMEPRAPSP